MMVISNLLGMAFLFVLVLELPADDPLQRVIEMRQKIDTLDLEVQREEWLGQGTTRSRLLRWTCLVNKLRTDFPTKIVSQEGTVSEARGMVCVGCYEEQDRPFFVEADRAIIPGGPKQVTGTISEIAAMDKLGVERAQGTLDMRKISLSSDSFGSLHLQEYTHLQAWIPIPSSESPADANITVRDYRDSYGRVHRYWFDANQGNQIVRYIDLRPENIESGVPEIEVKMENQQLGNTGIWFPKQVIHQRFSNDAEHKLRYEEKVGIRILSFDREECGRRMTLTGIDLLQPGDVVRFVSSEGTLTKTWDGAKLVTPAGAMTEEERQRLAVAAAQKLAATDWVSWGGVVLGAALIGAAVYFALGNRRQQ